MDFTGKGKTTEGKGEDRKELKGLRQMGKKSHQISGTNWSMVASAGFVSKSHHIQVQKRVAELLLSLMAKIGVMKLTDTPRAERLAHMAGKLAQDCDKDTRHYGQEMVKMLLNHQKLKRLLEQSVSTRDLEDIMTRIKKKVFGRRTVSFLQGMENQKAEHPSVKKLVKKRNDGSKKPQTTLPSSKQY
ncbi:hypothetical protein DUI87_29839 [Hirundo rustica rustica]|uniref:CLASP N-terminal domain-containing protein n=1 Tax=Hirundo rustica rustica TaxID=333673 RepID=A0A3M0J3Y1_HIRRU|nr:hypothetical protein DUI87_29839 [Hirundo rustica rustica]